MWQFPVCLIYIYIYIERERAVNNEMHIGQLGEHIDRKPCKDFLRHSKGLLLAFSRSFIKAFEEPLTDL